MIGRHCGGEARSGLVFHQIITRQTHGDDRHHTCRLEQRDIVR
jgi:hypothetical protein